MPPEAKLSFKRSRDVDAIIQMFYSRDVDAIIQMFYSNPVSDLLLESEAHI